MSSAAEAPRVLDPQLVAAYRPRLYGAARALCPSHHEAEDLVQETFARVLARPRLVGRGNELPYLLRALRNTHFASRRAVARRPSTVPMPESDFGGAVASQAVVAPRELMAAIAAAPKPYRDAVVAIDVLGLSYEQAARRLQTNKGTINSRLFRGREHIARVLDTGSAD